MLDEADRMLDMGFIRDIRRVLAMLPSKRQNLLFSATFSEEIRALANGLLRNPLTVEVAPRNAPAELVEHRVHLVRAGREARGAEPPAARRRHAADAGLHAHQARREPARRAARRATASHCAAIHGNKSQSARTRALADFKEYKVQVLVATDIAARGLDISELPQVVNYELPHVPEDYVHRIGRTGRAGATGQALSLVSDDERDRLRAIERVLGRKISVLPLDRTAIRAAAPADLGVRPHGHGGSSASASHSSGRPYQGRSRPSAGPARRSFGGARRGSR